MTTTEFEIFRADISRELGAITERLRSLDQNVQDIKGEGTSVWRRIDDHTKEINLIKVKVAAIAAAISFVVTNFENIMRLFNGGH